MKTDYAPAGDTGPLSLGQKRNLVRLARRAFRVAKPSPPAPLPGGEGRDAFDAWRNAVAIRACGLRIREATQRDWGALRAAFQDAAGESGQALNTLVRDEDNPRRVALHFLAKACSERGLPLAYPSAICRRQNRCELGEATAAQVWRLVFTVKNRRKIARQDAARSTQDACAPSEPI